MNIKREQIETEQVLSARPAQTTVEAEIALPGGLREEAKIYHCDASVRMNGGELAGSRVTADGRVTFHVLYAQGDLKKLSALEAGADFTQSLPLVSQPDAAQALPAEVTGEILSVSAKAFGGRLMLSAVVRLSGEAVIQRKMSRVDGIDSDAAVLKTETIAVEKQTGEGESDTLVRETVELPGTLEITDTLYATADAQIEDILPSADGTTAVTGILHVEAYHATANQAKPLIKTRHVLPFEMTVTLSGAPGDRVMAQAAVRDVAVLLQENGDSPEMRVEIQLHARVTMAQDEAVTLMNDVFLTEGDELSLTGQNAQFRCGSASERASESLRLSPVLPAGAPKMRTAVMAFMRLTPLKAEAQGGKLTIEGVAACDILYLTDDSARPVSQAVEEPFRVVFQTQALPSDPLSLTATDVEVSAVTGDHAEIKCVATLTANGARRCAREMVTDVTSKPAAAPESGLTLYFLQPGEGLWEVAKRRRVTPEALKALNPDLPENPASGTPVLVYRA